MKILKITSVLFVLQLWASPLWAYPVFVDFGGNRPSKTIQISDSSTWTQDNVLTLYEPASSVSITFTIEPEQDPSGWVMTVTDRISMVTYNQQASVFPAFVLNGHVVPSEAIPWGEFKATSYQVGKFLRPGKNVLQITASTVESVNEYQLDSIVFGPPTP